MDNLTQIKEFSLEPRKRESFLPWAIFMSALVLPFLCMLAYWATNYISGKDEKEIREHFMNSMEVVLSVKQQSIDEWLAQTVLISQRMARSNAIQNLVFEFSDEVLVQENETLQTFAEQQGFMQIQLTNNRLKSYLKSFGTEGLPENSAENIRQAFSSKEFVFSPVRVDGLRMLLDLYLPVFDRDNKDKVISVLVVTLPVHEKLKSTLNNQFLRLDGASFYLFQTLDNDVSMIRFESGYEGIFSLERDIYAKNIYKNPWKAYSSGVVGAYRLDKLPKFGSETGILPNEGEILIAKQAVQKLPLLLMGILDLREAYKTLIVQRKQTLVIGQLMAITVFVMILALWWRYQEGKQHDLNLQYYELSEKINASRRLLMSVNGSLQAHIGLKYFDGKYVYVNEAFAEFLSLKVPDVLGLDDKALYGEHVANELEEMDATVLKNQETIVEEKHFLVKNERKFLKISKSPFLDGNKKFIGILTVIHDETALENERHLRDKTMKNAMRAMMRVMERHDGHLMRHARLLSQMVQDMGAHLKLSAEDKMTLEMAANLSQIGKIYVPVKLLEKENSLTGADLKTYQNHIEHTAYILDTVDWGLPVVKTVYGMYERLDGSGYPNGLSGEDISTLSRILAICDVFCTLVSPRRGGKIYTPEEAVKFMISQKGKFDLQLIQLLAEVICDDESVVLAIT